MKTDLDPTTIAIIARGLHAAAEEMGVNLVRSAFSTVVREARDCSTALLDPQGNIVAQAEMIPMQTAALSMSFKAAMARLDLANTAPGEAVVMNDPYHGGQHLNDIFCSRRSSPTARFWGGPAAPRTTSTSAAAAPR